ncbi:MAG: hypothetical protein AABX04_06680 [Nanoarchaeota archaeon]
MLNRKQIGKIQLIFGIVLFVATMILSVWIIKEVYIGALITGVSSTTATWGKVSQEINTTSIGINGLLVSNLVLQGQIVRTTTYLFGWVSVVLLVLSIILILQGLSNLATK